MCLCVYFVVFASWFDWTNGPQSLMPFPGFDWLFFVSLLISFPSLCCMPPGLTSPALAHSPHLPLSCASSRTSSIHADGHLRPQRSLGGAAQPPDKLLLPDLSPGSGQARGLSAGTASPLAPLLLCALMCMAICSSAPPALTPDYNTSSMGSPLRLFSFLLKQHCMLHNAAFHSKLRNLGYVGYLYLISDIGTSCVWNSNWHSI